MAMGDPSERDRFYVDGKREAQLADDCFKKVRFLGTAHREIFRGVGNLRRKVKKAYHYSVYAALVQTSGLGKTRAVLEMSKLGVYICYCSLAGESSTAYPPRSGKLADKLSSTYEEIPVVLYLKAWLLLLKSAIDTGVSAVEWKNMQLPGGTCNLHQQVLDKWEELIAGRGSSSGSDTEMEDPNPDVRNHFILQDAIQALQAILGRTQVKVIFVFDEARGLQQRPESSQSPFYQVRRALRVFFNYRAFFALMLDTAAKMSNLLPTRSNEDSSRALKMGISLLHPLYFLPNMDLYRPRPGLSVDQYAEPQNWAKYGRPIWAARLEREDNLENLLLFAVQKLVCVVKGDFQGQKVDVNNGVMTESQAMAVLTAAVGLDICSRSVLAEVMAASHMNLVLRVSEDSSRLYVRLPPEPILAEAAAYVLADDVVREKALMRLETACMAGYVTPGPRGEFVAKFILVAAMWSLKESMGADWCLQQIPVETFLETLLISDPEIDHGTFAKVKQKVEVVGGRVFFNSFVAVRAPPDAAMLGRCYAGGQAIMYSAENNLPGADMIIPVWTLTGMTAIVISVKNMVKAGWLETVSVDKVKCEFTEVQVVQGLPVITIVMSLRETEMKWRDCHDYNWLLWEDVSAPSDDPHVHITCYGIRHNFSFLSVRVKEMLRKVLVTVPDPVAGASAEEVSWIHQMLPQEFEKPDRHFSSLAP